MSENKTLKLPSGKEITLRPMTAMDDVIAMGALPDARKVQAALAEKPDDPAAALESLSADEIERTMRSGIKAICRLCIKPRYWADPRPIIEQEAEPKLAPEGFIEFDLTTDDYAAAMDAINEMRAGGEETGPLSKTA